MSDSPTRIQKTISLVLTVVFLATVVSFGVYGVVSNRHNLIESLKTYKARSYVTDSENADKLDLLKGRFQSFQSEIGEGLPFSDELATLNAKFQLSLNKNVISQGKWDLAQLDNGQYYALTTVQSLQDAADEVAQFMQSLGDIPCFFNYVRPQFFEGVSELPEAYRGVDTADRLADEVLSTVSAAGIETLDARTFFADSGIDDNLLNFRTDMHWKPLAGLLAAQKFAEEINRLTGANLDVSKLSLDQFDAEFYPDYFLGEYGQQIGESVSGLDDITLYVPKYETALTRYTIDRKGNEIHTEGTFGESIIHREMMDATDDEPSLHAYSAYGLVEQFEEIENLGDCADMTILIYRDSYTAPIGSFLSLLAKHVIMVDVRTAQLPAADYVKQYDPDIVIVSFSQQMMQDHHYELLPLA